MSPMLQPWMNPADLAPGDSKSATLDWTGFELHPVRTTDDPMFAMAFHELWNEFGAKGEIEQPGILAERMRWNPSTLTNGCALLYDLLLITRGGEFVGVRDHTAIVRPGCELAVVHMSHNLVARTFRRSGIAGWLRALPAQTARSCMAAQHISSEYPICLVGEMEPADSSDDARTTRLTAYEKAGYKKIDPSTIRYLQPDFRAPADIDADGGPKPLPLDLLVRFVGHESLSEIPARRVRDIILNLYSMYGVGFRTQDMKPVFDNLRTLPDGDTPVALIPPTSV